MTRPTQVGRHLRIEYADDNNRDHVNTPTNWSFGQLSQLSGAPAGYLKDLPAPLAADCIQWGLRYNRGRELVKVYGSQADGGDLRAATGPDYGRIFDWEILEPVKQLVDQSGGRWKVPGMMVGSRNGMAVYDPEVPVTNGTPPPCLQVIATFSFSWLMIATLLKWESLPTASLI
jgi:hypothetical protein